jgi:hypothetical protein
MKGSTDHRAPDFLAARWKRPKNPERMVPSRTDLNRVTYESAGPVIDPRMLTNPEIFGIHFGRRKVPLEDGRAARDEEMCSKTRSLATTAGVSKKLGNFLYFFRM